MIDYKVYLLSSKEKTEYYALAFAVSFLFAKLFYDKALVMLILFPFSILFENKYAEYKNMKRRERMLESFKDALYCISGSIAAGRQLPYAIYDAYKESLMFNGCLTDEFKYIFDVYDNTHGSIDELLSDLGERSGLPEIILFANSCKICRKSGGDLEKVCLRSAYSLIERIDYQREVSAVLSEKKMDMIIMLAMPILILMFLYMSSYDYIAPLYESLTGRIIMSICLLLIALATLWSLKMMQLDL